MINNDLIIERIITDEVTFQYTKKTEFNENKETIQDIAEILITENYIKLILWNGVNIYINKNEVKTLAYKDFEDVE